MRECLVEIADSCPQRQKKISTLVRLRDVLVGFEESAPSLSSADPDRQAIAEALVTASLLLLKPVNDIPPTEDHLIKVNKHTARACWDRMVNPDLNVTFKGMLIEQVLEHCQRANIDSHDAAKRMALVVEEWLTPKQLKVNKDQCDHAINRKEGQHSVTPSFLLRFPMSHVPAMLALSCIFTIMFAHT